MSLRYGGGFEEWLKKTVEVLSPDFEIRVASGTIGDQLRYSQEQVLEQFNHAASVEYINFFQIMPRLYVIRPSSFFALVKCFKWADYVYFNYAFILQEMLVWCIKKLTKSQVLVAFHAPLYFEGPHDFLFNNYASKILKSFSAFHVLNAETRDILAGKGFNNLLLIPNYVLSRDVPIDIDVTAGFSYTFVGRYEKQKGVDLLVGAIRSYLCGKPHQAIKFDFYGSGSLESLVNDLVNDFPQNVKNHGFVLDKKSMFLAKSFIIAPSRQDQMSLSILEAMSFGIPIIASSIPATTDLIKDGQNGLLIKGELNQEQTLVAITRSLEISDSQRLVMGQNSRKLIRTKYTEQAFMEAFMKGLNSLYQSRRSKS